MTIAFFLRLAFYCAALAIPYFHQGVVIDYDLYGIGLYFLLIPGQALLAFFFSPPQRPLKQALFAATLFQLGLMAIFSGYGWSALPYLAGGVWGYVSTYLLFRFRWRIFAVPEILYIASIYLRLINFTRGITPAESGAGASGLPQILLFAGIVALLGHLLIVMFALRRPEEERGGKKEYAILAGVGIPLLLAAVFLVPPNFVSHSIVFNQLFEPPKPDYKPLDDRAEGLPDGNLQGNSSLSERRGRNGQPGLFGLPADQWGRDGRQGDQEGRGTGTGGRQYAVMVVASPHDPTYLADAYFGAFDPVTGFGKKRDLPLNSIVARRLLETWVNPEVPPDRARLRTEVFTLSTRPDRVLAYLPLQAEPTVYDRSVYPFTYSYHSVSAISVTDPDDWRHARELTMPERSRLEDYLTIDLDPAAKTRFQRYLTPLIDDSMSAGEKIIAILKGFRQYQYEIGFAEDVSVQAMENFLFVSKHGDCTEFSNTAAILGRLAGIPTRVVTGYLASSGLQTLSHLQGLAVLRENIPALKSQPLDELYLVTTAHRHSWTQFYLPEYGWIDFETTEYAIPPLPGGDPNSQDVVIPMIEDRTVPGTEFSVPWRLLGQAGAALIVLILLGLYGYRYGHEIWLASRVRRQDRRGLLAAEKLLLIRLANEGVPLKMRSETPREYTEKVPQLQRFAEIYDELRFRERLSSEEHRRLKDELMDEVRKAVDTNRRKGLIGVLKRLFTLKGLAYK